jgi:GNAT superfamily N-acetyltransferase
VIALDELSVRPATPDDVPALTELINRAFDVERSFKDGDRITAEEVADLLARGRFLVLSPPGRPLVASIYVEVRGERGYFGLLSVEPGRQGAGIGKRLVAVAEAACREAGCTAMDIKVVNLRTELPPIYRKLGYVETGTLPFEDPVLTKPVHFITMSKPLS